jgi:hypothetical protein
MRRWFDLLADDLIARVQAASIGTDTEVALLCHCVDLEGQPVPPVRMAVEPVTLVRVRGEKGTAPQFAPSLQIGAIIDNINSVVRRAPLGIVRLPDGPSFPVIIRDFTLEISKPK